jgi:single-strand DNA-binding protein
MASVNKVILIGNLGADPELKYTPSNRPLCNLSVATNEVFKDKSGQRQERTEWHRVTVWGEQAETCSKYLGKGRSVYVEGKLQTRSWDDKDGKKRYSTDIVADRVVFLGGGGPGGEGGRRGGGRGWGDDQMGGGPMGGHGHGGPPDPAEPSGPGPGDDDIPF